MNHRSATGVVVSETRITLKTTHMATKSIKGTKTESLLLSAYLAESAAYSRYTYYAQQATKEKYFPVAEVFNETAANELRHGKVFFKMLQGGMVEVLVNTDAGVIGTTVENLAYAIAEEEREGVEFYTNAAKVATDEGFKEIASHFLAIAEVERHHHDRFMKYKEYIENGTLWKRDKKVTWRCLVCGYESEGTEPPKTCPGCDHPYQHYICVQDLEM